MLAETNYFWPQIRCDGVLQIWQYPTLMVTSLGLSVCSPPDKAVPSLTTAMRTLWLLVVNLSSQNDTLAHCLHPSFLEHRYNSWPSLMHELDTRSFPLHRFLHPPKSSAERRTIQFSSLTEGQYKCEVTTHAVEGYH